MKIYWSPSVQGFFDSRVNSTIPKDAVEISPSHRNELIEGCKRNQVIVCRANGFPILADAPPATPAEATITERQWRDAQLSETDPLVARHRDEMENAQDTTLSAEQFTALQQYRRNLRNWPSSAQFPAVAQRPVLSLAGDVVVKKPRARTRAKS